MGPGIKVGYAIAGCIHVPYTVVNCFDLTLQARTAVIHLHMPMLSNVRVALGEAVFVRFVRVVVVIPPTG